MKAIETRYAGYKFRSRLEARWAIFFDAMGVEWEYEPEGYVLSDGTCYLPDFWLPRDKAWVEIKPLTSTADWWAHDLRRMHNTPSVEQIKCFLLADGTGHPVILFRGLPGIKTDPDIPGLSYCSFCTDVYWGWHPPRHRWSWDLTITYEMYFNNPSGGLVDFLSSPRVSEILSDCEIPEPESPPSREHILELVRLDREYFRRTYEKEHYHWQCGFMGEIEQGEPVVTGGKLDFVQRTPATVSAYKAARSARFEHGETP